MPENVTAVHIKALVDSGCTLDPGVLAGMFQAERALALREAAVDPALRLSGHSGIGIGRLKALGHIEESGSDDDLDLG